MSLHLWNFTNDDKTKIFGQFNKSIKEVEDDVELLREWLKKQPHIPEIKDKNLLEIILMRCKFSIEKTKLKLDKYFTVKTVYKEIFEDMDPQREGLQRTKDYGIIAPLEDLTPNYERIIYCAFYRENFMELFNFKDVGESFIMFAELALREDYAVSNIFLVNAETITMAIIKKIDLGMLIKFAEIFLQGFSARVSAIHFINTSSVHDVFVKILSTVLPKKIHDRMMTHKDVDSLAKHIPENCIPKEVKGFGKSVFDMHEREWAAINSQREDIVKRNREGTIESLRIGEHKVNMDLFGANGTFKKINLD